LLFFISQVKICDDLSVNSGLTTVRLLAILRESNKIFSRQSYIANLKGKIKVMSNIEERVKKIIVEQLGVDEAEVKNEASFVDDLGADSLDTVELVMALEEEFDIEIPDEDAEKITTVQAAIDFANSQQ